MTITVALNHRTHYTFDRPVNLSPHIIRLRPAPHCRTPIISYSLNVSPKKHFLNWQQDPFGNYLARLVFPEKTRELIVDVEVFADMTVINPFDFFVEKKAEYFPFSYSAQLQKELAPYLEKQPLTPKLKAYLNTIPRDKAEINTFLVNINKNLQKAIKYSLRLESGIQTPEETLALANGSCRDTSWLLVQLLRHIGLAARFASGYLVQLKPDEKSLDGPSGADNDFTDLHAWCEVYLPGAGWVGLDPTSGLFASEGHIPLACTPDPVSAAPISGETDPCEVSFQFSNEVRRIHEDPRVTKPYTEEAWQDILALGHTVDTTLSEHNVRLTMGGEPTFVSIDDMESAQWNTDALGDDKLALSRALLLRLKNRFAPDGLLYYGMGKWYPGEVLPRWTLGFFWRNDGKPTWHKADLLANIGDDQGHTVDTADDFINHLAGLLGVDNRFCQGVFENEVYYLQEAEKIPVDINLEEKLAEGDNTYTAIAKKVARGFERPAGFILPLIWDSVQKGWLSSRWPLRNDKIILTPGDSPMGFRLPLDDLPANDEEPFDTDRDPFDTPAQLPDDFSEQFPLTPIESMLPDYVVKKALCVEARGGTLHVFIPPVTTLEIYLQLIAAIEATAKALDLPVIIEGYEAPRDSRLQKLLITPDPGVIEVNVHPAHNWQALVDTTTILYKEARLTRLATEKFMLDGRHTGTGGGNHITLGGATPADSPLLRRPDLLRSLITFWQHHPSLSYLFSGMFIGPTSQAPRVDEGRDEILYELELAFSQITPDDTVAPWLVDRLFRNLLIDVTGNTHRAEFCIDKLYSPSGTAGRLGILEFRGFEMPPHSRMALVQALLIRCLIARFWVTPYHKPLVRWGTRLHDKFMLPHFIHEDIAEVIADLNEHGFAFNIEWLAPFEEFRFPHYGRLDVGDISMELRWAIEPWHVLGEETDSFGTARYVDSSVERLQIRVTGLTEGRYIIACNGQQVPLTKTARKDECVAGVRYKAWSPPSALHPTMPVNTPLTFDIIDTWNNRSIGGCTYHVSHPGGRSYNTFPLNAFEAESRRNNRFDTISHTQGIYIPASVRGRAAPLDRYTTRSIVLHDDLPRPMQPPKQRPSPEYPNTLDLRQQIV